MTRARNLLEVMGRRTRPNLTTSGSFTGTKHYGPDTRTYDQKYGKFKKDDDTGSGQEAWSVYSLLRLALDIPFAKKDEFKEAAKAAGIKIASSNTITGDAKHPFRVFFDMNGAHFNKKTWFVELETFHRQWHAAGKTLFVKTKEEVTVSSDGVVRLLDALKSSQSHLSSFIKDWLLAYSSPKSLATQTVISYKKVGA